MKKPRPYKPTNVPSEPNRNFYVADGYVHRYNAQAEYVRAWGGKGKEAGQLDCPQGIWVGTRSHRIVVMAGAQQLRALKPSRSMGSTSDLAMTPRAGRDTSARSAMTFSFPTSGVWLRFTTRTTRA
jgi:hypothetical protein